jgi:Ca2+-dependent lipid-binding protein
MTAAERLKIVVQEMNFKAEVSGGWLSDPAIYIKIIMGDQEFKTKTRYGKGKNPRFDEEFDLGEAKEDKIIVQAYDEGTISDTFIGECTIFMDQLKIGKGIRNGYTILKEIKAIGNLFIESVYVPALEDAPVEEESKPEKANQPIQPTLPPAIAQVHNP